MAPLYITSGDAPSAAPKKDTSFFFGSAAQATCCTNGIFSTSGDAPSAAPIFFCGAQLRQIVVPTVYFHVHTHLLRKLDFFSDFI